MFNFKKLLSSLNKIFTDVIQIFHYLVPLLEDTILSLITRSIGPRDTEIKVNHNIEFLYSQGPNLYYKYHVNNSYQFSKKGWSRAKIQQLGKVVILFFVSSIIYMIQNTKLFIILLFFLFILKIQQAELDMDRKEKMKKPYDLNNDIETSLKFF